MLSHCVGRDACGVWVREGERRGAEGGGTASSRGTQAYMTGGRAGEDDEGQRWMSHTLRHACRKAQAPAMRHARMINGRHAAFMPTVLHSCMRGHAACDADCRYTHAMPSCMPCPHVCHAFMHAMRSGLSPLGTPYLTMCLNRDGEVVGSGDLPPFPLGRDRVEDATDAAEGLCPRMFPAARRGGVEPVGAAKGWLGLAPARCGCLFEAGAGVVSNCSLLAGNTSSASIALTAVPIIRRSLRRVSK